MLKSICLAVLAAGLKILLFPNFEIAPLAWVVLVPLLFAIESRGPLASFLLGCLFGVLMALGITYWLYFSVTDYFGLHPLLGFGFILGACLFYAAIYCGLFTLLVSLCRPLCRGPWGLVAIPAFWVTCEVLRATWVSEDPWGLLGYSQYSFLPLIQVADITGVYGVTFLIVLVNVAVYQVLRHLIDRRRNPAATPWTARDWGTRAALPCLLLAAVLLYGKVRLDQFERPSAGEIPPVKVAVIQGSIHREYRWKSIYYGRNLTHYLKLSRRPETLDADLLVWPENALNFHPDREPMFLKFITRSLAKPPRMLLTGAPHMVKHDGGGSTNYNTAYQITEDGIQKMYHKMHLMPFSERKPGWIAQVLAAPGEAPASFTSGERPETFSLGEITFASPICFEMVYPELVRRFVQNGAQFLVNISNDSWFGPTAGPRQHLIFSTLRAVENRRAVVRAANTGISALVAPSGRILSETRLDEQTILTGTVVPRREKTIYTRTGDLLPRLCAVLSLAFLAFALTGRRPEKSSENHPKT